jgi:hypothetical protein
MALKNFALILILASLLFPMVGFGQQVISCCKLVRTIKYEGVTYTAGYWYSESKTANPDECAPGAPAIGADCNLASGATNAINCATPDWGTLCLINAVAKITNWVTYIALAVVAVMVIIGALNITTAAGSPEKVTTGRNYILFAVVGLVIAILSRAIPSIAARIVGAL